MKTFNDLKRGDKVIIKNLSVVVPCNVMIDGHKYVSEVVTKDEECTVCSFPHYYNELGSNIIVEFYLYDSNGISIKRLMWSHDLDKTETDEYKIVQ